MLKNILWILLCSSNLDEEKIGECSNKVKKLEKSDKLSLKN